MDATVIQRQGDKARLQPEACYLLQADAEAPLWHKLHLQFLLSLLETNPPPRGNH